MGFTAQLIAWDDGFCEALADRGRHVIRFDNRDCGLSTQFDGQSVDPMAACRPARRRAGAGRRRTRCRTWPTTPSACSTRLGIDRAHVVGASMGGMIVQTMAIEHPERVPHADVGHELARRPAAGKPTHGGADVPDDAAADRARGRTSPTPRDGRVGVEALRRPRPRRRARAAAFDRSFYPEGAPRQLAAIYASGDRTERPARRRRADARHPRPRRHADPARGRAATAEAIPDANLLLLAHMGHDLPEPLWPMIVRHHRRP